MIYKISGGIMINHVGQPNTLVKELKSQFDSAKALYNRMKVNSGDDFTSKLGLSSAAGLCEKLESELGLLDEDFQEQGVAVSCEK